MLGRLAIIVLATGGLSAQDTVPLYNVTVIEHSLQAVNYQYLNGPTEIDFRGTVLLPKAKGHATVESHRGRTEIDAKLQGLGSPQIFGREYLTYVLWAISPEGAAHNLGEVVPNGSGSAHIHVTTELQAFGLLITAEPYSAVRQAGNVVVMENQVRPETIGKIEPIQAKADLLPRGSYVLDKQQSQAAMQEDAPKVSMGEYEQLSQIYQAENALALARAVNADQLAPDVYGKAQQLLAEAKEKKENKAGTSFVVQAAREAAETADDARVIALKRADENKIATLERQLAEAKKAAEEARAELSAARAQTAAAPRAVEPAPVETAPVEVALPLLETRPAAGPVRQQNGPGAEAQLRGRLLGQLKNLIDTRDTPRGLVMVVPDADFAEAALNSMTAGVLAKAAQILTPAGLQVAVEGNTDSTSDQTLSAMRADAVREALVNGGFSAGSITVRDLGNTHPTTSNATEAGRRENRRVEIVVSGAPIGETPLWSKPYSISSR
jgi:flagellar motor protein MotB